jgi:hypothetical protein
MVKRFRFGLNSAVLVAFIGILSGVIGAFATAAATSRATLLQNVIELRKKGYAEFLNGQSLRRGLHDTTEEKEANKAITDAKLNIFMVASPEIICSTVSYWIEAFPEQYPLCKNDRLERKNAEIYQAMRKEFFASLGLKNPKVDPSIIVPYLALPFCVLSGTTPATVDQLCRGYAEAK